MARNWNEDFQGAFQRMRRAKQWSMVLFALLLAGCAAAGPSADDMRAVRSIRIAPALNPVHFGLAIGDIYEAAAMATAVGPAAADGAISGSLAGSAQGEELTHVLEPQNLRLGDELTQAVAQRLRTDGFEVTNSIEPSISTDATLRLSIAESTYVRRVWGKIGPHLVVDASLTDRGGRKLFHRIYRYDMHTISMGPTLGLTPSDRFGFDSSEEVLSHPEIVAAGFRAAIPMIASDMGRSLRKRR